MDVDHRIAVIKAVPSLMMQHLDSIELKTKFLLVLTKWSWERRVLSSGFMTNVSVKLSTIMVIMVSSPRRNFDMTVRINNKVSHSLASAPNTRMRVLNMLFRPSCIWCGLLWFTPPYIGQKEAQMTFLSGPLLQNIRFGFIIMSRMFGWALLHWN
jgi:hypothetical protein